MATHTHGDILNTARVVAAAARVVQRRHVASVARAA
jgi:hypothetical protein